MIHLFLILHVFAQEPRPGEEAKVRASLESLVRAMGGQDKEAITGRFHVSRMLQEFEERGGLKFAPEGDEERTALLRRLRAALPGMAAGSAMVGAAWERIRVLHLKVNPEGKEAEAFGQVTMGGDKTKVRFWLVRDGEEWKVYDMEFLEGGIRLSVTMGSLVAAASQDERVRTSLLKGMMGLVRAMKQFAEGEVEEARGSLEAARRAEPPALVTAWIELFDAQALQILGKDEEAVKAADRALELQKDLALAHHVKAAAFVSLEEHEKAIAAERDYMKLVGDDAEAWYQIGECYESLKKTGPAIEAFRKGAESDDEEFANRLDLGRLLLDAGRAAEAKPHLVAASRNAPPEEDAFGDAAALLDRAGEFAAVLEIAEERVKRTPEDVTVLLWQGRSLRKLGRLEGAEKVLRKAVEDEPDEDELVEELVFTLAQAGKEREALERAGERAEGDEEGARWIRLFLHAAAGRTTKGIQELKPLLEEDESLVDRIAKEPAFGEFRGLEEVRKVLEPARATHEFMQAVLKVPDDDWEAMLKLARERTAAAPQHAWAYYYQGYALRRLKRFEEAAKALREAVVRGREPRRFRDELGRALAAQGKLEDALFEADRLLEEDRARESGLSLRVVVYALAKRPEEALKALAELLKEFPHWHSVVTEDADLAELKKRSAFQDLVKRAKEEE